MLLCLQRYDYILHSCPGKEMVLPDTLLHLKPKCGWEIALDIAIHLAHLSPVQKEALQLAFETDVEMCALADIIISGWPDDIKEVLHPLHPYWKTVNHILLMETLWITYCWRWTCVPWRSPYHPSNGNGEGPWYSAPVSSRHHQNTVTCPWLPLLAWHQQSHWGSCLVMQDRHEISGPECCCTTHTNTYTFTSLTDRCIRHFHIGWCGLPHPCWFLFQGNLGMQPPCKPKQLYQSHPHPEGMVLWSWHARFLCTDNGPQYASAAFADVSNEWGFTHETSSQHYPQSNGFAESCVKIIKHMLQHAKDSGTNSRIALQHLKATPVDTKLPSTSQMLHNCKICTTIPSRICNTDPAALQIQEHLEDWAEQAKSYADKCSK